MKTKLNLTKLRTAVDEACALGDATEVLAVLLRIRQARAAVTQLTARTHRGSPAILRHMRANVQLGRLATRCRCRLAVGGVL